jgi:hypothetical protein
MEHQNYITSINTNQPITTRKFFNHLSKTDRQNIERFFSLALGSYLNTII